jgi:dephospho-CoA kinase
MNKLFTLITGASGSGKTTILKALEQALPRDLVSVHRFDHRGVPSVEEMVTNYGSAEKWQEATTHAWIKKLAKMTDQKLIFLEGSFNPTFAVASLQTWGIKNYVIICLHADRKVREARLIQHRKQSELATQEMENFAQVLKTKTLDLGGVVIDSSIQDIPSLVREILEIIIVKHEINSKKLRLNKMIHPLNSFINDKR